MNNDKLEIKLPKVWKTPWNELTNTGPNDDEDLLLITNGDIAIDLGYYNGKYTAYIIIKYNWAKPFRSHSSKNLKTVLSKIHEWVTEELDIEEFKKSLIVKRPKRKYVARELDKKGKE